MLIDKHYSVLEYQPIDFIKKYNLNFIAGNIVKLCSRFDTTDRSDLTKEAQFERIRFYLKNTIENLNIIYYSDKPNINEFLDKNKFKSGEDRVLLYYFASLEFKNPSFIQYLLKHLEFILK